MLATDDEAVIDAYRRFGWALGLAFQLNDDLLGIWGDEEGREKTLAGCAGSVVSGGIHIGPIGCED